MLTEVRMPKLGMKMKRGTVKRWLAAEGETVEKGSPLLEVMTDKVNAVIEVPASGVLGRVVAAPGTEVPVGALLALLGHASDTFPPAGELTAQAATAEPSPAAAGPSPANAAGPATAAEPGEVPASPAARRLARERGIDIARVPPATPGKRVTTDDVEAYAASQATAEEAIAGERTPFDGIRRMVAEHLSDSLRTMAQVTITREAEVSGLVALRARLADGFEEASGIHLTYTDLLIHEVARLLLEYRRLNAYLDGETIVVPDAVHMGFAVALDDGLIVPVVRDAHVRTLAEIARDRAMLAAKARAGAVGLDEIEGGTFTITNLGAFGADAFTPIVNPPQCAILGVGRVVQRPWVESDELLVRPAAWLSLTFDHRLLDGALAARFLGALAERLAGGR